MTDKDFGEMNESLSDVLKHNYPQRNPDPGVNYAEDPAAPGGRCHVSVAWQEIEWTMDMIISLLL